MILTTRSMAGRPAAATSRAGPGWASASPPQRARLCVHCLRPHPRTHATRLETPPLNTQALSQEEEGEPERNYKE